MMSLREALDMIWHDAAPRRTSAAAVVVDMDDEALLDMLEQLLIAEAGDWLTVHREPHALHLRYRGATAASLARLGHRAAQNAIIRLTDIDRVLVVDDDSFAKMWGACREYSAASILAAQQFARDHVDSLLYLPNEMRQRRLEEVSYTLDVTKELLLKFAVLLRPSAYR